MARTHACGWQARRKRGPSSLRNLRRGRQVRVYQGERADGSVGSVVIGRRRGLAASDTRTARAGPRGAGEHRSVKPPNPAATPSHCPPPPRPGGDGGAPRGDGRTCGNEGTCCVEGACGDEEACGGAKERDDPGELLPPPSPTAAFHNSSPPNRLEFPSKLTTTLLSLGYLPHTPAPSPALNDPFSLFTATFYSLFTATFYRLAITKATSTCSAGAYSMPRAASLACFDAS